MARFMDRGSIVALAIGLLVITALGYLAYQDPQSPFKQPVSRTQHSEQTSPQVTTQITSISQRTASTQTTIFTTPTTTQVTRRLDPAIRVYSLTVRSRILSSRNDIVTLALELKNDGGPGIAVVQFNQIISSTSYVLLEETYMVPGNSLQVYVVTSDVSMDADNFTAIIVRQTQS